MTTYEAVEIIEGFGIGEDATREQTIAAWQNLIDSGVVWELQGKYGRGAVYLIEQGICKPWPRKIKP